MVISPIEMNYKRRPFSFSASGCETPLSIARRDVWPLIREGNGTGSDFNILKAETWLRKSLGTQKCISEGILRTAGKISRKELERRKNALERDGMERQLDKAEGNLEKCEAIMRETVLAISENARRIDERADKEREKGGAPSLAESFVESEAGKRLPDEAKKEIREALATVETGLMEAGVALPDYTFATSLEMLGKEVRANSPSEAARSALRAGGLDCAWIARVEAGEDYEDAANGTDWQAAAKALGGMGNGCERLESFARVIAENIAVLKKNIDTANKRIKELNNLHRLMASPEFGKLNDGEAVAALKERMNREENHECADIRHFEKALELHLWGRGVINRLKKDMADYLDAAKAYAKAQAERESALEKLDALEVLEESDGELDALKARNSELKALGRRLSSIGEALGRQLNAHEVGKLKLCEWENGGKEEPEAAERKTAFVYEKKNGKTWEELAKQRLEEFVEEAKKTFAKALRGGDHAMDRNFERTLREIAEIYVSNGYALTAKMLENKFPHKRRVKSQWLPGQYQKEYSLVRVAFDAHCRQRLIIDVQDAKEPQIIFVGMKTTCEKYMNNDSYAGYAQNGLFSLLRPE